MEENTMNVIYNETLGNGIITYTAFCETDIDTNISRYGITVKDHSTNTEVTIRDFTLEKETMIDFTEILIRNTVSPDFVREIAEDYLSA